MSNAIWKNKSYAIQGGIWNLKSCYQQLVITKLPSCGNSGLFPFQDSWWPYSRITPDRRVCQWIPWPLISRSCPVTLKLPVAWPISRRDSVLRRQRLRYGWPFNVYFWYFQCNTVKPSLYSENLMYIRSTPENQILLSSQGLYLQFYWPCI